MVSLPEQKGNGSDWFWVIIPNLVLHILHLGKHANRNDKEVVFIYIIGVSTKFWSRDIFVNSDSVFVVV